MGITSRNVTNREADTGAPDPAVTEALEAWARGAAGEHEALTSLARARLIVPVVAMLTEPGPGEPEAPAGGPKGSPRGHGGRGAPHEGGSKGGQSPPWEAEKETEMALPTLVGQDGRAAVLAFTGTDSLSRWNPGARPMPSPATRVWEYARAEGNAVVIDVAGPVPLVVEGARLAALGQGQWPPMPHEDPDVHAMIAAVTPDFTVEPGPDGSDFLVTLRGLGEADARRAAGEISARIQAGGRFRRGVGFRLS